MILKIHGPARNETKIEVNARNIPGSGLTSLRQHGNTHRAVYTVYLDVRGTQFGKRNWSSSTFPAPRPHTRAAASW